MVAFINNAEPELLGPLVPLNPRHSVKRLECSNYNAARVVSLTSPINAGGTAIEGRVDSVCPLLSEVVGVHQD